MKPPSHQRDHQDLFRYTSGRWLWEEDARLQERYRTFNVSALQDVAISHVGARHCVSVTKIAEGGFNKVFRLVMDNGVALIARIPTQNASPLSKSVASEVATMDFAATVLGIPVPKVLSWNTSQDNPVQSEFILMEEARGIQLGKNWASMDLDMKAAITEDLASIVNRLLSVSFSRYGNIYFSADRFPGCESAILDGSVPQHIKAFVQDRYVIGPVVERSFWDGEREKLPPARGPWTRPEEYIQAIATREIAWLREFARQPKTTALPFQSRSQSSPEQHITLYQKLLKCSEYLLPADDELVKSTLWHWDLHAPNIFVTGNKISAVIDWQDCWAGPLMLQARRPRLVDFQGNIMLKLPSHYQSLEDGPEKQEIRATVEKSLLLFSFESEVQRMNPGLEKVFSLPHAATIRDAVLFAANTWDGGIIPLRECLMKIYRNWKEICPNEQYPFSFSADEICAHKAEGDSWNKNADFWSSISGLVARDGFVLREDYDEAFAMFANLRDEGLRTLDGLEKEEFDRATSWASRPGGIDACLSNMSNIFNGLKAQSAVSASNVTPGLVMNGTLEGAINDYIRRMLAQNPAPGKNITTAQDAPPFKTTSDQIAHGYSSDLLPDGCGRVFHPHPNGHQLISILILHHVEAYYAAKLGQKRVAEKLTSGSGNLPIGTKACVGRAVVSAGAASADGCTRAG